AAHRRARSITTTEGAASTSKTRAATCSRSSRARTAPRCRSRWRTRERGTLGRRRRPSDRRRAESFDCSNRAIAPPHGLVHADRLAPRQSGHLRGRQSLRNQMLERGMIERDAGEDIERKGEAEGHGDIEAGVGCGHGGLHHCRYGDIRRAGAEDGEEQGVALVEAEELRDEDSRRRADEGENQGEHDWKQARLPDAAEAAAGGETHVEQEQAERAAEDALREGRDLVPAAFTGEISDHEAAEQEKDGAVEQALDGESQKRAACRAAGGLEYAQAEEPGHDGGTF